MKFLNIVFIFILFSSHVLAMTYDPIFDELEGKQNQENFMAALVATPSDVYEEMLAQYNKDPEFSFPAMGYSLAMLEKKLREIIAESPTAIEAKQLLIDLLFIKKKKIPFSATKLFITKSIFFLQSYFGRTGQLVKDDDLETKYNKTQNYDRILGEYGKKSYCRGFELFYLYGEIPIEFFNRTWHLPFSPLQTSINPINLFDFSVGGPQTVISHDLVHHNNKNLRSDFRKNEKLVTTFNDAINKCKNRKESGSIIDTIELIFFYFFHESCFPKYEIETFKNLLIQEGAFKQSIIKRRVKNHEFPDQYNRESLEADLIRATEILLEELSAAISI